MKPCLPNLLGVLAFTSGLFLAGSAFAQGASSMIQKGPIVSGSGRTRTEKGPPPPGLPGAAVGQDRVSPSERANTDMQPTDALFDAINRGDINSARDALNRGADFTAKNVLGMTPIDESIDLGRNDITFLLLSLRGSAPTLPPDTKTAGKPGQSKASEPKVAKAETARKPISNIIPVDTSRTILPRTVSSPQRQPMLQAQAPRSGDAGSPNPQSGFLGFGG